MSLTLRVFVNGSPVDVNAGAAAIDCVRAWQPAEADAVASGSRVITDSRGLPVSPDSSAHAGSIYRTVTHRASEARST